MTFEANRMWENMNSASSEGHLEMLLATPEHRRVACASGKFGFWMILPQVQVALMETCFGYSLEACREVISATLSVHNSVRFSFALRNHICLAAGFRGYSDIFLCLIEPINWLQ